MTQGELEIGKVDEKPARMRLKTGKGHISYRRLCEGKEEKIFLTDEVTGKRIATVFTGRRDAEYIAMCVNLQA